MRDVVGMAGIACMVGSFATGCFGGGDPRFPKRPEGCEITVYHLTPEVPTDNIGPVHAACAEEVTADDCLRTLKDEACKMGGDVVWGVDEPEKRDGKVHYNGRAAHTKAPKGKGKPQGDKQP